MNDVKVISYQINYYDLNLALFKQKRRLYEIVKIEIMLKELQERGMYAHKINKPTKNGTSIKFKALETVERYKLEMQKIIDYTRTINKEFGYSFKITLEGKI